MGKSSDCRFEENTGFVLKFLLTPVVNGDSITRMNRRQALSSILAASAALEVAPALAAKPANELILSPDFLEKQLRFLNLQQMFSSLYTKGAELMAISPVPISVLETMICEIVQKYGYGVRLAAHPHMSLGLVAGELPNPELGKVRVYTSFDHIMLMAESLPAERKGFMFFLTREKTIDFYVT